MINHFLTLS